MYPRFLNYPEMQSFFLFGPRGVGKTSWVRSVFKDATYVDLLNEATYQDLVRHPERFATRLAAAPPADNCVVVDEIQRLPNLLNEIHRLIEEKQWRFVLTGSSARKLRRQGVNLLAGRARTRYLHALTAEELGSDFAIAKSLQRGHLPTAYAVADYEDYLQSYVGTYLREEVQQEALVRNVGQFGNFLNIAAYSQASVLNVQNVARECGVDRKTADHYFTILEDLLLAVRLPVFQRRAKRKVITHNKFYFFDAGVFRTLRKRGPLDVVEEIDGAALETLVLQELRAVNDNHALGYDIGFWRTAQGYEVDFVLYGQQGFWGIEVKHSALVRQADLKSLNAFLIEYPEAQGVIVYTGTERYKVDRIRVEPVHEFLPHVRGVLT